MKRNFKYIVDCTGKKRKRTADDAPCPIIRQVNIDVGEIWRKAYERKNLSVAEELEKYLDVKRRFEQ